MLPKYTGSEILAGLANEIIARRADETHISAFFAQISARVQDKGLERVLPVVTHALTILAQTDNDVLPNQGVAFLVLQLGSENDVKKFLKRNLPGYIIMTINRSGDDCLVIATRKGIKFLLEEPRSLSIFMLTDMPLENPSLN